MQAFAGAQNLNYGIIMMDKNSPFCTAAMVIQASILIYISHPGAVWVVQSLESRSKQARQAGAESQAVVLASALHHSQATGECQEKQASLANSHVRMHSGLPTASVASILPDLEMIDWQMMLWYIKWPQQSWTLLNNASTDAAL